MKIHILTLFPETFKGFLSASIIKRAQKKEIIKVDLIDLRDFGLGPQKQVDDKPYGGGKGMVLMMEPILNALKTLRDNPYIILLSASGKPYNQKKAQVLGKKENIALICGHYEGIDARVEKFVHEIISVGDFILTGGEVPAMIIVDSVVRLIPGVISKESLKSESFSSISNFKFQISNLLLEYPQYTRPDLYKGLKVPSVLTSGNHQEIKKWREAQSKMRTKKYRPDLLKKSQP